MSLEKIANNELLGRADIIAAANELSEIEKQAEAADSYGRELAHEYVAKLAEETEVNGENEKVAEDEALSSAIEVLRKKGVIASK